MGQDNSKNPAVDAFLTTHQCLNAMPDNSVRILKLLQDPNFRMKQLVKMIEQDAAIAAKVIQTVNSAAYARSNRITNLERATVYLGFRTMKEIVVATTVSALCKPISIGKYAIRDLWDHSLGVAVLCREFALRSKLVDPETAFLAGILHDVGLLLSAQSEVDLAEELFRDAEDRSSPFRIVEEGYFNFDHCDLGAQLAAAWNFPAEVTAAIQFHHLPGDAPSEHRALCLLVYIADTVCVESGFGFPLTTALQKVSNQMLNDAGLAKEDVTGVLDHFKVLLRLHQG